MGGAYTAKPPADTTPDVPPGWNPVWPHPGVSPPGYIPVFSLAMTGQDEIIPGMSTSAMPVTLNDHVTYATQEPNGLIVYTAEWANPGEIVRLKFSGDSDFSNSITGPFIDIGSDFWGAEPEFEFEIDDTDIARTIILTSISFPFDSGEFVETTKEILVVAVTWSAKLTFTITDIATMHPDGSYGGTAHFQKKDEDWDDTVWPRCWVFNAKNDNVTRTPRWENNSSLINKNGDYEPAEGPYDFGVRMQELDGSGPGWGHDDDPWILDLIQEDGTMVIEVFDLGDDYNWYVGYNHGYTDTEGPSVTFSYTLQIYRNDDLQTTKTFSFVKSDNDPASTGYPTPILKWEIDKTTKAVTTH